MSRTEIDRMNVLHDLVANRINVTESATLMSLGRRQVFRLAKAYGQHGPGALVSRRRGRPSNRCYPTALLTEVIGIIRQRVQRWRWRSWRSCTAFIWRARRAAMDDD